MTTPEKIATVLSVIAIVISIAAILISRSAANRGNEIQQEMLSLNHASLEYVIKNDIENWEAKVEEYISEHMVLLRKDIKQLSGAELSLREGVDAALLSRREKVLSAYDTACQKYRDGKVDKVRFRKALTVQLRQTMEAKANQEFITGPATKFNAMKLVYQEWENLELPQPR